LNLSAATSGWSANGTVTYVDGNKVYAFGHPNLTAGTDGCADVGGGMSFHCSRLLQNSFKLAVALDLVGAFSRIARRE